MLLLTAVHLRGNTSMLTVHDRIKFIISYRIFLIIFKWWLIIHNYALITAVTDDFQDAGLWIKLLLTSVREQDWIFKCYVCRAQIYIMFVFHFTYFTYFCPVRYPSIWISNETVIWKTKYLYFIMLPEIWKSAARYMDMNHPAVVF